MKSSIQRSAGIAVWLVLLATPVQSDGEGSGADFWRFMDDSLDQALDNSPSPMAGAYSGVDLEADIMVSAQQYGGSEAAEADYGRYAEKLAQTLNMLTPGQRDQIFSE